MSRKQSKRGSRRGRTGFKGIDGKRNENYKAGKSKGKPKEKDK